MINKILIDGSGAYCDRTVGSSSPLYSMQWDGNKWIVTTDHVDGGAEFAADDVETEPGTGTNPVPPFPVEESFQDLNTPRQTSKMPWPTLGSACYNCLEAAWSQTTDCIPLCKECFDKRREE